MKTERTQTARYLRRSGFHHFVFDAATHSWKRCSRGTQHAVFAASAEDAKKRALARNVERMQTAVRFDIQSRARYIKGNKVTEGSK